MVFSDFLGMVSVFIGDGQDWHVVLPKLMMVGPWGTMAWPRGISPHPHSHFTWMAMSPFTHMGLRATAPLLVA